MRPPRRIRWRHVQRLYEAAAPLLKAAPVVAEGPERGRVLVLSPHIDDDVIGAGGCLRKHALAGDDLRVVYFADCTDERIREAEQSAAVIGLARLDFFAYCAKTLDRQRELPGRLADILQEYRPATVYAPSLFDRHNDHLAVNHLLAGLILQGSPNFTVCSYEIWTALVPNLVVDITAVIEAKRDAIACHRSQLAANDWADAAIALNRYRGVTAGAGKYAEGFMRLSAKEFAVLWKRVYGT